MVLLFFSQSKLFIYALSFVATISLHLKYTASFRFLIHFLVEFLHISFWFQVGKKTNTRSKYSYCSRNLNIDFTKSSESICGRVAWEKRGRRRRVWGARLPIENVVETWLSIFISTFIFIMYLSLGFFNLIGLLESFLVELVFVFFPSTFKD